MQATASDSSSASIFCGLVLDSLHCRKNGSDKDVIAYSVGWTYTNDRGKLITSRVVNYDFSRFPSRTNLPPAAMRVIFPPNMPHSAVLQTRRGNQDALDALRLFNRQQSIVITIEAIAFSNGTAVGPDPDHWINRWKAEIEAERDVYQTAAHSQPGSISGQLDSLIKLATEKAQTEKFGFRKDETLGRGHIVAAANHAQTYEDAYVLNRGISAMMIVDLIKEQGEVATIAEVGSYVDSKQYPTIHQERR
jgi:hypothetical protein